MKINKFRYFLQFADEGDKGGGGGSNPPPEPAVEPAVEPPAKPTPVQNQVDQIKKMISRKATPTPEPTPKPTPAEPPKEPIVEPPVEPVEPSVEPTPTEPPEPTEPPKPPEPPVEPPVEPPAEPTKEPVPQTMQDYVSFLQSEVERLAAVAAGMQPTQPVQPAPTAPATPAPATPTAPVEPTAPVPTPPQPAPTFVPFATDKEFNKALEDRGAFNEVLGGKINTYIQGREEQIRQKTMQDVMPIITNTIAQYMDVYQNKIDFYKANPDLENFQGYVSMIITKNAGEHPDWSMKKLFEESGKEAKRILRQSVDPNQPPVGVSPQAAPPKPATLKKPGARPSGEPILTEEQKEIQRMINRKK